ncbi:MAG: hypothetical protein R3A79_29630 [Nannocystaceae bacterium]
MRRRSLWPLLAASALLAPLSPASAKPGGATKNTPSAPTTQAPESMHKIPAPPCGLHETGPGRFVPSDRRTTKVTAKYAIGAIGETITLKATLVVDGSTPVALKPLEFTVDGQVVGTAKTNSKGEATLAYKIPNLFGAKPLQVRYAGNNLCKGSSDDGTVGTVRASTSIALTLSKYANVGTSTTISAQLKRTTDGAVISGREVDVYVAGAKVATVLTNTSGRFQVKHTPMSGADKPLEVKAHFTGDVLYVANATTASTPLYPPLQTVYLRWSNATGFYGQTLPSGVIVTTGSPITGAKFKGAPVRMWSDDDGDLQSLGEGVSTTLGIAQVPLKLTVRPGIYRLGAHADIPRERYTLDKGSATLRVHKAPVALTVTGPSAVHIGAPANFTVKAVRTTDNKVVKGLDVCYLSKCAETDAAGRATLSLAITSDDGTGTRNLSFTSREDAYHVAGAKSFAVTVQPSIN